MDPAEQGFEEKLQLSGFQRKPHSSPQNDSQLEPIGGFGACDTLLRRVFAAIPGL